LRIGDRRARNSKRLQPDLVLPLLVIEDKRIAALMPVDTAEAQKAQNQVIFLENFSDELRRKVPVGK